MRPLCPHSIWRPEPDRRIIRATASGVSFYSFNMVDEATRRVVSEIPLLKTLASPRDKEVWVQRLKEEYQALIKYVENNKNADNDWFRLESNKEGTRLVNDMHFHRQPLGVTVRLDYYCCIINREGAWLICWFHVRRWFGKCWYIHDLLRYEFDVEFDIPVTYPSTAPEIAIPELDGKTAKMYRGGKICLTEHFKPLWARNVPKFGLAHLMALGLGPWLAVEIPDLISKGLVEHKSK
ncbi:hypothetical protein XENTR_v10022768 [Xenopus tropicalis]|nr:hypothetical protein XENTR_v10022768 [Xenopus tropicalis]